MITIVMPAYNAERYIEKTINSVQSQTYQDWQLVVVDDCSTDNTVTVVKSIAAQDPRVSLIELENNFGGPAGPRNVGVAAAKTEYVAFLDADDIWHPEKLEAQLRLAEQSKCDLVCSTVLDFYDDTCIEFDTLKSMGSKEVSFASERYRNKIPTSSVVVRNSLARKHPFNEAQSYRAVEDYDAWLRMLEAGAKCIKVNAPLVMYRKIHGQISGSKWQMARKVLMVHRNRSKVPSLASYLYTFTNLVGAFYSRVLLKRM